MVHDPFKQQHAAAASEFEFVRSFIFFSRLAVPSVVAVGWLVVGWLVGWWVVRRWLARSCVAVRSSFTQPWWLNVCLVVARDFWWAVLAASLVEVRARASHFYLTNKSESRRFQPDLQYTLSLTHFLTHRDERTNERTNQPTT